MGPHVTQEAQCIPFEAPRSSCRWRSVSAAWSSLSGGLLRPGRSSSLDLPSFHCRSGWPCGCSVGWRCRLTWVWVLSLAQLGYHNRRRSRHFDDARRGDVGAVVSWCAMGSNNDTRWVSWWGVGVRTWLRHRQSWVSLGPTRAWVSAVILLGRRNMCRFSCFGDASRGKVRAAMSRV